MKTLFASLLLIATTATAMAQEYSVRGTINEEANGKTIYLAKRTYPGWTKLDSTVVKDRKFEINGNTAEPQIVYLLINDEGKEKPDNFVLENSIIAIDAKLGEGLTVRAMGTKANDAFNEYKDILGQFSPKFMNYRKQLYDPATTQAQKDSITALWIADEKVYNQAIDEFVLANCDNYTGFYFLRNLVDSWPVERTKAALAKAPADIQATKTYKNLADYVVTLERVAVGKPYSDISGNTPEGKEIKLSDYIGKSKLILVDFWASWCGPCMQELPNVIKAYETYHPKGLEIIGVSLDNSADAWKGAITKNNMPWPQMSDLKGWQSAAAATYAVHAIPATLLLDENGIIIERNLRGEALQKKLAELLD